MTEPKGAQRYPQQYQNPQRLEQEIQNLYRIIAQLEARIKTLEAKK